MKARMFSTVMLVVLLALIAVSGRSEAAPPTLGKPAGGASFSCANVTQIPKAECDALVALYIATNGSNWSNIPEGKYWLSTDTPCNDWFGITCSGGQVTELRLGSNNNLTGAIPQDMRHLTHLTVLDLGHNKLNGWIPSVLGELTDLRTLFLRDNPALTWSIPPELGNLTQLRELSLSQCNLFGPIPSTLENLTELTSLDVSFNYLSGWVTVAGSLPHLEEFRLRDNRQLRGPLPRALADPGRSTPLTVLQFGNTAICEWPDQDFQDWVYSLTEVPDPDTYNLRRTRILCGALPAEVQLHKSGSDAVSEWSHRDPNTEYGIHRDSAPYVPPSSATKLATLNPQSTSYTDEGALVFADNYFYVVQSKFNDVTADSNETAAFTYALVKGIEEQDSLPTGAGR